jgi:hypothetical protein
MQYLLAGCSIRKPIGPRLQPAGEFKPKTVSDDITER